MFLLTSCTSFYWKPNNKWWSMRNCRFSRSYAVIRNVERVTQISDFAICDKCIFTLCREKSKSNCENWDLKCASPFQHCVWPRTTALNGSLLDSIQQILSRLFSPYFVPILSWLFPHNILVFSPCSRDTNINIEENPIFLKHKKNYACNITSSLYNNCINAPSLWL